MNDAHLQAEVTQFTAQAILNRDRLGPQHGAVMYVPSRRGLSAE
jgi:hypothetical protein